MRTLWLTAILFVYSGSIVNAAVWINEISPSTSPEWVELYNDGSSPLDLSGWLLEDGNSSHSDDVPLTGSIDPGGYVVFSHTDGWLNNSGDTLKLYNNATPSAIIDQYTYQTIASDKTTARSPNGSENWVIGSPTQGMANPTPTPSPTPSPSPSLAPSPTPPPSPLPSPTPMPTPTHKPSPSIKPSPTLSPEGEVEGATDNQIDLSGFGSSPSPIASPKPSAEAGKPTLNRSRAKTALIVGLGLLLTSLAGFFGYRKYRQMHKDGTMSP